MARFAENARPESAGLRCLSLALAFAPAAAHAGAWIAPKAQSIWTEVAGARDAQFFTESSLYVEAPVTEDIALVASPWVTNDPDAEDTSFDALRWEVTLAAKAAVLRRENRVMAVQGGVVWVSDPERDCGEAGVEARWLGGATSAGGRGFANIEAAGRWSEGCSGTRAEVTFGYRQGENWLSLAQVFADQRTGDPAVRAQISVVRLGENGRGLQLGVRARVDGEAAEPALVLGFWRGARD